MAEAYAYRGPSRYGEAAPSGRGGNLVLGVGVAAALIGGAGLLYVLSQQQKKDGTTCSSVPPCASGFHVDAKGCCVPDIAPVGCPAGYIVNPHPPPACTLDPGTPTNPVQGQVTIIRELADLDEWTFDFRRTLVIGLTGTVRLYADGLYAQGYCFVPSLGKLRVILEDTVNRQTYDVFHSERVPVGPHAPVCSDASGDVPVAALPAVIANRIRFDTDDGCQPVGFIPFACHLHMREVNVVLAVQELS